MPSYTDPFGGSTVQTAQVAYRAFTLAANLALAWPQQTSTDANVAARTMDVSPSGAGFSLALPQANQVSVGYDLLITNRGANSFTLTDFTGVTVATLSPGQSKYVQVTVNSTTAGTWNVISFGVGTSSVDAASLVGPGIGASGSTLYASEPVSTFSVGNTITAADRAKTYVWTGGLGTQQLPAAGTVTDFFYSVRNQGTGALTIAANGAEQVDGASSIVLQPAESATVHAGVGNWYSVGRGRSAQFNFTLLIKNITGGTVTLTTTEAANVVQRYTGVLVSNANIVLPSVVQVYYVSNQTTGAFTVTFKTAGVGSTISVPSNQNAVLFCDGTNVINASTTVSGLSALLLAQGSATAPSLGYSGDSSTGIYQPASSQVAITLAGTQRVLFATTGITSTLPLLGPLGSVGAPAYSYSADPDTGMWSPGANLLAFSVGGAEGLRVSASQVSTASPFVFAPWLGAVGTPSYSFTGDLNTGMWSPAADTLAISVGGVEGFRVSTSQVSTASPFVFAPWLGAVGTPSYSFTGDLNTGMWSPGADIIAFSTSGAEKARLGVTGLELPLGAVGTPSYSFAGDLNTGMWSPAADQISLSANGAERMRVSASNTGVKFFGGGSSAADVSSVYSLMTGDKILWVDSSRTANNKEAEWLWSAGAFSGRFVNDAYSGATTWVSVSGGQAAGVSSIIFSTGASVSALTIDSAGAVLVARSASANSAYKLQIGDGSANSQLRINSSSIEQIRLSQAAGNGEYFIGVTAAAAPDLLFRNNSANTRLTLTDDGRLFGSALHNNAGSVTGTTNQYIASGTYTPTLTNVSNITSSTARVCQWIRVGNVVMVSGAFNITVSVGGSPTELGISLPIASTFTAQNQCGGTGAPQSAGVNDTGAIAADTTNVRMKYITSTSVGGGAEISFSAMYVVV